MQLATRPVERFLMQGVTRREHSELAPVGEETWKRQSLESWIA